MDINWLASVVTVLGFISVFVVYVYKLIHAWIKTPIVIWGFYDFPESRSVHYFIRINGRFNDQYNKQDVSIILHPLMGPFPDIVKVTEFWTNVRSEHRKTVELATEDFKDGCKKLKCRLLFNVWYRIAIEGRNCDLEIESPSAVIIRKNHEFTVKISFLKAFVSFVRLRTNGFN